MGSGFPPSSSLSPPPLPSTSPDFHQNGGGKKKRPGFVENALKYRGSYVQLFFMTGVMLLSMRSLGQKYRIHDLEGDTAALREENQSLSLRMESIKQGLLREASLDPSGLFASKLCDIFGEDA